MFEGLESMLHMTCVGNTKAEVTGNLNKAKNLGIRNILGKETTCCEYFPFLTSNAGMCNILDCPTNSRKKVVFVSDSGPGY
jgi:hypothetical protein